jgi:hypothetical protein
MKSAPAVPQLSLVVKWPHHAAVAPAAQLLIKLLAEKRISATWAIEQPAQAERLRAGLRGRADAALLINPATAALAAKPGDSADFTYEIHRSLDALRGADVDVSAVQIPRELTRGVHERRLRELGVRAVICGVAGKGSGLGAPRALPFGMWQLSPQVSVPVIASWRRFFGRKQRVQLTPVDGAPLVADIDLARVGSPASRSWQAVDRLLREAVEFGQRGVVAVVSVAELAAGLSQASAARPQRSILRAAA